MIERVAATGLLPAGRAVVVLLSGGRDSVCLLDIAVALGARVTALHVNYGLRSEADADAAACAELCSRLRVPLEVRHGGARPDGVNLQAWARDRRYAEAAALALPREALIATGHTTTDQVETVLYRLAASPGRRALLGMPERDGRLVRPLLAAGLSREDTAAHCRARGLSWLEDASNLDPAYARNRVRSGLLAALREIHPAAEANLLRTLALLRDEAAVLDAIVADALAAAGEPPLASALSALPPAIRRLALQRLADDAVGGRAPAIGQRTEEILALAPGGALDLGEGVRAQLDHSGALSFGRSEGLAAPRAERPRGHPAAEP